MQKFYSIQALRFIAAAAVMVSHIVYHSLLVGNSAPALVFVRSITDRLVFAGVDLFFVISGTIMYLVTRRDRDAAPVARALDFGLRRAFRIYPVFWVSGIFAFFVLAGTPDGWELLSHALLLGTPPYHPVAWSMVYEVRFYLMVAVILLVAGRHLDLAFGIWAVGICAIVYLASKGLLPADPATHILMLEFVIGVAVGALIARAIFILPRLMIIGGLLGFLAATYWLLGKAQMDSWRVYGYGLPMAMILYGSVGLEQTGRLKVPPIFALAGDMSYSLYLWHLPVALALRAIVPTGGAKWGFFYIVVSIAASLIVSYLSFRWIERPAMSVGARLAKMSRTKPAIIAPA